MKVFIGILTDWFSYRLALYRLWQERHQLERKLARWTKASAEDTDAYDDEFERANAYLELQAVEDERAVLLTQQLIKQAYWYGLPLPQGDVWDTSLRGNRHMLRAEPLAALKAAVTKEENERWNYWELRLKVLGMVLAGATGLVGALIGLAAITK